MFQYAMGRCLAEKRKDHLYLETSSLSGRPLSTPREYGLSIFNIRARFTNKDEIIRDSDVVFRVHQIRRGFYKSALEYPRQGNIALDGYWQNELYFKEIEDIIRNEFTFKSARHESPDQLLREQITSTTAVCVHVRRGDYLLPKNSNLLTVGIDYYKMAVNFISTAVRNPHFYLFSDDISWCMDNLSLDYPCTFIRRNRPAEECTAEDFRLMTLCRHFIIANSSFSWWAAWLGSSGNKIVIAPATWFRDDREASEKIAPSGWVRL
jgi:hypothetical protein